MEKTLDISRKELTTKIKLRDLAGNPVVINPKKILSVSNSQIKSNIQSVSIDSFTIQRAKDLFQLQFQDAKQNCKVVASQLYLQFVTDPNLKAKNNGRKPTDVMVRSRINTVPQYAKMVRQMNKQQYYFELLKDLSYDLQNKVNLLQTQSSNLRTAKKNNHIR